MYKTIILALGFLFLVAAAGAVETSTLIDMPPYLELIGGEDASDYWEQVDVFSLNETQHELLRADGSATTIHYTRTCMVGGNGYYSGPAYLEGNLTIENIPGLDKSNAIWEGKIFEGKKMVGTFYKLVESVEFHPDEGDVIYL